MWFVVRTTSTCLRFIEPIVRNLRADGHEVVLAVDVEPLDVARANAAGLGVRVETLDLTDRSAWRRWYARRILTPARELSSLLDQGRHWPFALRRRWLPFLGPVLGRLVSLAYRAHAPWLVHNPALRAVARCAVRICPVPSGTVEQLRAVGPDLVVVTPMLYPGSREDEALRAARSEGVPSAGLVLSWDNLSTKGSFHSPPDTLVVWNEDQRREAVQLYGVPSERIEAVGAPVFDYLFSSRYRPDRQTFLSEAGLPSNSRFLLYAVSSALGLGPGGEVTLVRRLTSMLRELEPSNDLRPKILVRPHPKNLTGWDALGDPDVVVWPGSAFPTSDDQRRGLVGSLQHADAVVGLNTTLFLEAAAVNRPCLAMRLGSIDEVSGIRHRFLPTDLVHFDFLTEGGFVEVAETIDQAARALVRIARGEDDRAAARQAFVHRFLRPGGLERDAGEVAARRLAALGR